MLGNGNMKENQRTLCIFDDGVCILHTEMTRDFQKEIVSSIGGGGEWSYDV